MKTLWIFLFLVINVLSVPSKAQKIIKPEDGDLHLVYSQNFSSTFAYWFIVHDQQYSVTATFTKIYLLDRHNLKLDSIQISDNEKRNPLQFLQSIDGTLVGHTMNTAFRLGIVKGRFEVLDQLAYKDVDKKWSKFDHFIYLPFGNFVGFSRGSKKKEVVEILTKESSIPVKAVCRSMDMPQESRLLGSTRPQISQDYLLFNLPACGMAMGFSPVDGKLLFQFNEPYESTDFGFVTYDPIQDRFYSIYTKEGDYYIVSLDDTFRISELVAISALQPISIQDAHVQVLVSYEGVVSHAMIPLGKSEKIPFVDLNKEHGTINTKPRDETRYMRP